MVIVFLWEEQKFLLCCKARLNKFGHISERVIDDNVEVAEPQKISVFANSGLWAVDSLDQLENLILLFLIICSFYDIFSPENSHIVRREIVI